MKKIFTITLQIGLTLILLFGSLGVSNSAVVPQTNWSLVYVDSQELVGEDGRGINSFDGNAGTIWHTEWKDSRPPHPHEIQIDLGATYDLESFRYLPRQDGSTNGRIKDYAFYVSDNSSNWGNPVASGTFANSADEKTVVFNSPAVGRYIRLVALNEVSGKAFTSMAEINVVGIAFSGTQPPNGVIDTPTGNVTIDRLDTVFFSGTGTDPAGLDLTYLWKFGDTAISDSTKEDPGNVQFNNAGSFTVAFTVTNSAGLSDFDTRIITVKDPTTNPSTPALIPKDTWNLVYVDSEELMGEDGRGENAFDGNPATQWHTEWYNSKPPHPHEIQIDLGAVYELNSYVYLPRQDGSTNGRIKDYVFYASTDSMDWGTPVASGTFSNSADEKEVIFDSPAVGRFIRLVALNEVNGKVFTSVAEINVAGTAFSGTLPPTAVIDRPIGNITIYTGDTVFFSGSGTDPENLSLEYLWNFDSSGIPDDTVEEPGSVQFNTAGSFTVTFTVTNSDGLSDSDTRLITVLDPTSSTLIPQDNWSLIFVDSEELVGEDGRGENAFDGNPATKWHTEWYNSKPPHPHEIQIDLRATYELESFSYLPRQDWSSNGRIKDYIFYVSHDSIDWGNPIASGTFSNSWNENTVDFNSTAEGQFIRLVALNEFNGKPFTAVAEINLTGKAFSGNYPPRGTINTPEKNLTIITGDSIYFSGSGIDYDNNIPLSYQWNFGDPNVDDDFSDSPGYIQFNHPGIYTVTFTVTDSLGRSDSVPPTRIIKVVNNFDDNLIPQTEWSLKYVDSEEIVGEDGRGENAFDGNPGTIWHTEWKNSQPPHPHEIQIDLGSAYTLDTLHYLPRQDGNSGGNIKDYAIYVSGNGADWEFPVAMGSFANTSNQKTVLFPPKTGRFISLVSLNEVTGRPFASAAEINIEGVCLEPYVKLVQPLNMHIQSSADLTVNSAVCLNYNLYPGWGVKLALLKNNETINEVTFIEPPYEYTFRGLEKTEYELEAVIVDHTGQTVSGPGTFDKSVSVGIGNYYVAIGDSITSGVGDDLIEDNQSQDGRNIQAGYTPILNDLLTTSEGLPHSIVSEGIGGIRSAGGLSNLPYVIKRHPESLYYLILYGTNDSGGLLPVPSGQGLNPGDSGYPGSFKDNMQKIIDSLFSAGKIPYLAKVPFTFGGNTRNNLIKEYNMVIDELVIKNSIDVVPPDFFGHFQANQNELFDTVHPNGLGYQSMANLWHDSLSH